MHTYKEIIKLTIPNILTTLLVPLAGIIDIIILGRLDSILPLAGVTLGIIIFDYLFWGFGFLRMGTTANVANLSGAGDLKQVGVFTAKSISGAFVIGIIIWILSYPLWKIAEVLLSGDANVIKYAGQYF